MNRLIDVEIERVVSSVERSLTASVRAASSALATGRDFEDALAQTSIAEAYEDLWVSVAPRFAGKVYDAVIDAKNFTPEQYDVWEGAVKQYVLAEGGVRIAQIDQFTTLWVRGAVRAITEEALVNGWGTEQIAKELRSRWKEISRARALRIAQTETNAAANYGAVQGAQTAGMGRKYWIPVIDGRTRHTHLAMATHPPIPITGVFKVGDSYLAAPSAPGGAAKEVVNCRCQLGFLP